MALKAPARARKGSSVNKTSGAVNESQDEVIEVRSTIDPSLLRKTKGKQRATVNEEGESGVLLTFEAENADATGADVAEEATSSYNEESAPARAKAKKRKRSDADDSVVLSTQRATSSSASGTVSRSWSYVEAPSDANACFFSTSGRSTTCNSGQKTSGAGFHTSLYNHLLFRLCIG